MLKFSIIFFLFKNLSSFGLLEYFGLISRLCPKLDEEEVTFMPGSPGVVVQNYDKELKFKLTNQINEGG